MSVTVATLVQLTRRRLHEASNSPIGEMASGSTGAATVSGESGIIEALNRVAGEICRTCFYFEVTSSGSVSSRTFQPSNLSTQEPVGAVMWMPLYVAAGISRIPLTYMSRGVLPAGQALTNTTAVRPTHWLDQGESGVELYPVPGVTAIFVRGAATPPVFASGDSVSFMSDELLQKLLPAGAASRIAMAEADNPGIAARGPLWQAEYDLERVRLWERTPLLIRNRLYPTSPGGVA